MNIYNKHTNSLKKLEPFIIIIFWVLLFITPLLFGRFEKSIDWNHILKVWTDYIPLLILFLINRFLLLPRLFFNNKRLFYLITVVIAIFMVTMSTNWYHKNFDNNSKDRRIHQLKPKFREHPPHIRSGKDPLKKPRQPNPIPSYANLIILSVLLIGFDTGLRVSVKWVDSENEKLNVEKENIKNQLAFLRNQVSPHFFMNTLNNIHSLIDIDTEEAKQSVIKLSKLMRYLLYESETEKIPIKKEIEFIRSYTELMQLRFTDKVDIKFNVGEIPDITIAPLLFTSLLENAFKHGVSYDFNSFIYIEFYVKNKQLVFEIKNSNYQKQKNSDLYSGIGIENTKKRLDLIYENNYSLDINSTENVFIVKLSISL